MHNGVTGFSRILLKVTSQTFFGLQMDTILSGARHFSRAEAGLEVSHTTSSVTTSPSSDVSPCYQVYFATGLLRLQMSPCLRPFICFFLSPPYFNGPASTLSCCHLNFSPIRLVWQENRIHARLVGLSYHIHLSAAL